MERKLDFGESIKFSFTTAFKNYFAILGIYILYILTIWIPYINIGTTIALTLLPAKLSRGDKLNCTYIFKKRYRNIMGKYLIMLLVNSGSTIIAFLFMFFPALVLAFSWILAPMILIDTDCEPLESLSKSNEVTLGHKWAMFWQYLFLVIIEVIVIGLLSLCTDSLISTGWIILISIITFFVSTLAGSINFSLIGYWYKHLYALDNK
ncbi:MAG: hypothetical protein WC140_04970 [Bacteroidales bacterium]